MDLTEYKNIYFIGIGGIGMSALSRYFNAKELNIRVISQEEWINMLKKTS